MLEALKKRYEAQIAEAEDKLKVINNGRQINIQSTCKY